MHPFRGTYTVMVTPFTTSGEIDIATLRKFVRWQIAEGIDGLIPLGSTGEFPVAFGRRARTGRAHGHR